jgi:hypothetical protein
MEEYLIKNSDFEEAVSGIPINWSVGTQNDGSIGIDQFNSHNRQQAVKITLPERSPVDNDSHAYFQSDSLTVDANTGYEFTAWYKATGLQPDTSGRYSFVRFELYWFKSDQSLTRVDSETITSDITNWDRYKRTVTSPSDASHVVVKIMMSSNLLNTQSLGWFDEVRLTLQ